MVMVLWVTAALGIVVTSISYMVRAELRHATVVRSNAADQALGRAAMVLALQELAAAPNRTRLERPQTQGYNLNGSQVDVLAMPLNGLLDINRAPAPLLAALLEHAGGMAPDAAQNLSVTIVEKRSVRISQDVNTLFDTVEDLLQVPGVDYGLYARLAPLITANAGGGTQVNPYAAPAGLLLVLASGNQAAVAAFMAGRNSGVSDLSGFNSTFLTTGGSTRLRMFARIHGRPSWLTVACDVSLVARKPGALPWEILQCDSQTTPIW